MTEVKNTMHSQQMDHLTTKLFPEMKYLDLKRTSVTAFPVLWTTKQRN